MNVVTTCSLQSGGVMHIAWNDANTGDLAASSDWYDRVVVTRDGTVTLDTYLYHSASTEGAVIAGGSLARSYDYTLPDGDAGVGNFQVTVTTDGYYSYQYEFNAAGTAESNNSATSSTVTSTITPYADLQVHNLTVTPSSLQSGDVMHITWNDANTGDMVADSNWYDHIVVSNTSTGVTLLSTTLYHNASAEGVVAAGGSLARSYNFALPDGVAGVGNLSITVNTDVYNYQYEYNAGGTGESNNSATTTATATLAPYANLILTDIQAPVGALAGRPSQVSWTVANTGDRAATGSWSEQVWLSSDDLIGGDQLLGTFYYTGNNLAASGQPGNSVTRTESVTLPSFSEGAYRLVVRVDTGNAVFELNETDNAVIDDVTFGLGAALSLTLNTSQVIEQIGAQAATATLIRSGSTAAALTVTLSSDQPDLLLPATIVIEAGQSSAGFVIGVTDNNNVDGNRDGMINAVAAGFADGTAALRILDNDVPALTLSATPTSVDEAYGPLTVTVTRNTDASQALTVGLLNNRTYKLTMPSSVVIPAGALSATFQATPVNDTVAEGDRTVDISANASGFAAGGLRLNILDNDIPTLTLEIANPVVSEGGGAAATYATLTRSFVTDSQVSVVLYGDLGRVGMPNYITFEAGQASLNFDIAVLENNLADGDHQVTIGASVVDQFSSVALAGTGVSKTLLITDNDGPTLSLSIDKNVLAEAAGANAATATVTRNTPADQ